MDIMSDKVEENGTISEWTVYEKDGENRRLVLSAPSKEEAEWAFDTLAEALPKYADKRIQWQYAMFDDLVIGDIV
jgi:hypothetical protein